MMNFSPRVSTVGAIAITLFLWGASFAAIEIGLEGYEPGALALLRFLIGSAALLVNAVVIRMPLPARRDLPAIAVLGLTGITIYHVAQNAGQQTVTAGTASFLLASVPVFTALLALIVLRERLNHWGWLGIGISFVGVALIAFSTGDALILAPGALLILLAAISNSIYFVLQKPYLTRYTGLQLTTYTIWAGTFFMLIYVPGLIQQIQTAPSDASLAALYLGIFPTTVGYVLWTTALSRISVTTLTSAINLLPILSVLIAWIWIGEIPTLLAIIGGLVTIVGVILLTLRGKHETRPSYKKGENYSVIA